MQQKSYYPKKVKKKRGWMNDEILSKVEQRKNVKNKTTVYNVINKEIVDECRQAKENWLNEQCKEMESLEKQYKTKEMYLVNGDSSPMCMCMGISSIRGQWACTCTFHNTLCMQCTCAKS